MTLEKPFWFLRICNSVQCVKWLGNLKAKAVKKNLCWDSHAFCAFCMTYCLSLCKSLVASAKHPPKEETLRASLLSGIRARDFEVTIIHGHDFLKHRDSVETNRNPMLIFWLFSHDKHPKSGLSHKLFWISEVFLCY